MLFKSVQVIMNLMELQLDIPFETVALLAKHIVCTINLRVTIHKNCIPNIIEYNRIFITKA